MDFENFPFLTRSEFAEVCHHLDSLYRRATLGDLRKEWKLRLCTAFDGSSYIADAEYTTFIQIVRPLRAPAVEQDDLSSRMANVSLGNAQDYEAMEEDTATAMAEDMDEAAMRVEPASPSAGQVVYEIHYHPTYRMPCLWFAMKELPPGSPALSTNSIYRYLVPDQYKDTLRRTGAMGAISTDHNPVTGLPSFFIHPCLVSDQMAAFRCSKETYLMMWLGLVGTGVGLSMPTGLAIEQAAGAPTQGL